MKKTVPIALLLLTLVSCIVASPQIALHAAKAGFNIWWSFIFPVLLPMYMLINLCQALGLFHSISSILISMFRIKNISASQLSPFIYRWFIGSTYIFPISTISSQIKPQTLSKKALMILLTLSYNANPIFIIVIVFTAFVSLPILGVYITICLAASTLVCALFIRLRTPSSNVLRSLNNNSFIQQLELGREEDGRPIGKLLGEGIYESVQQLFLLGGIMLFASVVAAYLQFILPYEATFNFMYIIDYHLASYALFTSPLSTPVILASIVTLLSFGGLTQLFITYGLFKQHQLPFKFFLSIRSLHSLMVILMLYINYNWLEHMLNFSSLKPTFLPTQLAMKEQQYSFFLFSTSSLITALLLLVIIALTLLFNWHINHHQKNKQA